MSRLLTRATAATRHLLWHCAIIAVLAAPLLTLVVPKYEIPSLGLDALYPSPLGGVFEPNAAPAMLPATPKLAAQFFASEGATLASEDIASAAGSLWIAGSCLVGLWFLAAHVIAAVLGRHAGHASPAIQDAADRLARDLGISRPLAIRVSDAGRGPLTFGLVRARVLLPRAAEAWDRDRLRTVLLHELAHVRRGDCRSQALAHAACALYWFNPLVWVAARALRAERERACDDEVLTHGAQASAYAAHLLEIARGLQTRLAAPAMLAMARPRELEGRLLAILAAGRARVPARSTRWLVAGAMAATTTATLGAGIGGGDSRPPLAPDAVLELAQLPAAAVPDEATRALSGALDDPSGQVREKAAIALALEKSPAAIPPLIRALRDADAQVREKAALGLGWRKDERVVEPLIAALRDSDPQVREKAALALGASGDARAAAPLEAALKDPDAQVREKAVVGLMMLRSGRDRGADGTLARDALRGIVSGLLRLTQ